MERKSQRENNYCRAPSAPEGKDCVAMVLLRQEQLYQCLQVRMRFDQRVTRERMIDASTVHQHPWLH